MTPIALGAKSRSKNDKERGPNKTPKVVWGNKNLRKMMQFMVKCTAHTPTEQNAFIVFSRHAWAR